MHHNVKTLGDVQSIDAARAWNNEYSLEGIVSYIVLMYQYDYIESPVS